MLIENLSTYLGDGLDAESLFTKHSFALGQEVEELMQVLFDRRSVTKKDIRECGLDKLIQKHTGLKCKLIGENEGSPNAYAMFPHLTVDHVAHLEKEQKEMLRDYFEVKAPKKPVFGWVDIKNGRIGGDFLKIDHIIGLDVGFFSRDRNFTAAEITAIILHEVGHLFYWYAALSWSMSSNYYMEFLAKRVFNQQDPKERILIATTGQLRNGDLKEIDEIANASSLDQIRLVMFNNNLEATNSALGINVYDHRGWEFLADKYAARAGYGAPLASGLRKMYKEFGEQPSSVLENIFQAVAVTFCAILMAPLVLLLLNIFNFQENIYDDNKKRLEIIRKQLIELMGEAVDPADRKMLLKQIDQVGTLIKDMPDDSRTVFEFLQGQFGPTGRKLQRSLTTQKLLEHFANSELRVAAERLKQ